MAPTSSLDYYECSNNKDLKNSTSHRKLKLFNRPSTKKAMKKSIKIKYFLFLLIISMFESLVCFDAEDFRIFISNPRNTEVNLNASCEKYDKLFEALYQIINDSLLEKQPYQYLLSPVSNPQQTTLEPLSIATSIIELDDDHLLVTTTEGYEIFNHKKGRHFTSFDSYHKNKSCFHHEKENIYFALNGVVKCWNHKHGGLYEPLCGLSDDYVHKVIQLQNNIIITICWREVIKIWNCENKKLLQKFHGHKEWIDSALQLHSGYFASASDDGTIKIWNPATEECITTLGGHKDWVRSIIQLKDKRLASASDDDTIKIWDLATKTCHMTMYGHTDPVSSIIQLCNGDLASSSYDKTIKIWNPSTGCCLQTLYGHNDWVTQLIQLSNGNIASLSEDNTIKIWHFYPDEIKKIFTLKTKKIIKRTILLMQLQHARKKNSHLKLPYNWLKIFGSLPASYQEMYECYIQREQCFIS